MTMGFTRSFLTVTSPCAHSLVAIHSFTCSLALSTVAQQMTRQHASVDELSVSSGSTASWEQGMWFGSRKELEQQPRRGFQGTGWDLIPLDSQTVSWEDSELWELLTHSLF